MDLDLTQLGIIIFFISLLGYIVGIYFDSGYLGSPLRPKGGDFERYLQYTSKGVGLIIFTSLLSLYFFYKIIPTMAKILFPQENENLFAALIIIYLLFLSLLVSTLLLTPYFGRGIRFLKEKSGLMEITIQADDRTLPIIASENYDENDDFFFYLDKNRNWGMIKKSHVSSIKSERKIK